MNHFSDIQSLCCTICQMTRWLRTDNLVDHLDQCCGNLLAGHPRKVNNLLGDYILKVNISVRWVHILVPDKYFLENQIIVSALQPCNMTCRIKNVHLHGKWQQISLYFYLFSWMFTFHLLRKVTLVCSSWVLLVYSLQFILI